MIKEEIDIDNSKLNRCLTRICDECGKVEETKVKYVKQGRKVRKSNIDLCWKCANSKKYRKLPTGEISGHWKHGITVGGYKRVFDRDRGERVLEHVYVMEKFLERKMKKEESIHHINLNKLDCRIENLYICNGGSKHHLIHSSLQKCGYTLFKRGKIFFDLETKEYTKDKKILIQTVFLSEEEEKEIFSRKSYIQNNRGRSIEVFSTGYKKDRIWKTKTKNKHVVIGETFLKRRFYYNEGMHHLDGDSTNNSLENLIIMGNSEHRLAHASIEKVAASFLETEISFNKDIGQYCTI